LENFNLNFFKFNFTNQFHYFIIFNINLSIMTSITIAITINKTIFSFKNKQIMIMKLPKGFNKNFNKTITTIIIESKLFYY
jgi:hypothetical protein